MLLQATMVKQDTETQSEHESKKIPPEKSLWKNTWTGHI